MESRDKALVGLYFPVGFRPRTSVTRLADIQGEYGCRMGGTRRRIGQAVPDDVGRRDAADGGSGGGHARAPRGGFTRPEGRRAGIKIVALQCDSQAGM